MQLIIKLLSLLLIILSSFPSLYTALNLSQMIVPSIVTAPEKFTINCVPNGDEEGDKFRSLEWSKLIDGEWKVFKRFNSPTPEEETNMTTEAPPTVIKLEDVVEPLTEDGSVEFNQSTRRTDGLYKCAVRSTKIITAKIMELRVLFKPEEGALPVIEKEIKGTHIQVTCTAPASYPPTVLAFFVNNELPKEGEIRYMTPTKVSNTTTYGENNELIMNVAELRIRATEHYILNGMVYVVCTATLADHYFKTIRIDIPYDGLIYQNNYISGGLVALIIITILVFITLIVGIVWFVIRKKKINSLNKVAELFNKQKSTLVVDKES